MTNTEEQNEIAHLRSLLKDKEDEIARLKLLIGTVGLPVSTQACQLGFVVVLFNCWKLFFVCVLVFVYQIEQSLDLTKALFLVIT